MVGKNRILVVPRIETKVRQVILENGRLVEDKTNPAEIAELPVI